MKNRMSNRNLSANSSHPSTAQKHKRSRAKRLILETLEDRRLMAADVLQIVGSESPRSSEYGAANISHSKLDLGSVLATRFVQKVGSESVGRPIESAANIQTTRLSQRWHLNLSPAVINALESARDLKQYSGKELLQTESWAVVTPEPKTIIKRLEGSLKLSNIQDRTDLFRDKLQVSVLELHLADPGDYQSLIKFLPADGKAVLELIPMFAIRDEATGTLDASTVTDGSFPDQWHLDPTVSNTQYGIDAENAWATATGEGVTLAVVDSRQDATHPDLTNNLDRTLNYDDANRDWDADGADDQNPDVFLPGGSPNYPNIADADTNGDGILDSDQLRQQSHGTSVAGLAIGDDDGTGIVGVAPDATYAAFNFLDIPNGQNQSIPDTFANANIEGVDVFNNSWGVGNSRQLRNRSFLSVQAVENAAVDAIFVKSAGNNRDTSGTFQGWDRANYESLHVRQTLVVGAARQDGRNDFYSNPGSNLLVTAPVNETGGQNAVTADVSDGAGNANNRGYRDGNINQSFNGTSAAAPMVSGTVALMLEANPDLDWRNIQHILIDTAQKNGLIDADNDGTIDGGDSDADGSIDNINLRTTFQTSFDTNGDGLPDVNLDTDFDGNADPYHTGWFQNAAGNWVSDNMGFGIVDAGQAVKIASEWTAVEDELRVSSQTLSLTNGEVSEGSIGALNSLDDIATFTTESGLRTEWVEVTINATVPDQDDLMLVLRSPSGTQSILMAPGGTSAQTDVTDFTFTTNQFWDESSEGM